MEIRLSDHAVRQIADRKLTAKQVIEVARAPEQIIEDVGSLPVAQSHFTFFGKPALLRVAFHDEGDVRLIVTTYPTTKIEKYWQVNDEDTL